MDKRVRTLPPRTLMLLEHHRFTILLATLALFLFSLPIMAEIFPAKYPRLTHVFFTVIFVAALFAAEFAVSRTRQSTRIAALLAVPTVFLHGINQFFQYATLAVISHCISIFFLGYIAVSILAYLFRQNRVTHDTICAAVCVYLLLGMLWAIVYSVITLVNPESFNMSTVVEFGPNPFEFGGGRSDVALYFSFVTLTTLGYGDITPATSTARMLTAAEALIGQLFLAVLLARLVGLHISQTVMRQFSEEDKRD